MILIFQVNISSKQNLEQTLIKPRTSKQLLYVTSVQLVHCIQIKARDCQYQLGYISSSSWLAGRGIDENM